jgi:hypothetical protein
MRGLRDRATVPSDPHRGDEKRLDRRVARTVALQRDTGDLLSKA